MLINRSAPCMQQRQFHDSEVSWLTFGKNFVQLVFMPSASKKLGGRFAFVCLSVDFHPFLVCFIIDEACMQGLEILYMGSV